MEKVTVQFVIKSPLYFPQNFPQNLGSKVFFYKELWIIRKREKDRTKHLSNKTQPLRLFFILVCLSSFQKTVKIFSNKKGGNSRDENTQPSYKSWNSNLDAHKGTGEQVLQSLTASRWCRIEMKQFFSIPSQSIRSALWPLSKKNYC